MTAEIDVLLVRKDKPGSRGYQYEVYPINDGRLGEILVTSRDPEYAACRRLLEIGKRGTVRFWRDGRDFCQSKMDIERGAKSSTSESSKAGIRIVKYNDFWNKDQEDNEELEATA